MPNLKRFDVAKDKPRRRSRIDIPYDFAGTGNEGALIPFMMEEVIAGDTFDLKASHCVRYLQTPARPTMHPAYLDTFYAFVPYRLLWKYWDKFFGVAEASDYAVDTSYVLPKITGDVGRKVASGSVANCLKVPIGYYGDFNNPLPLLAYLKIWSDHFRDQQTMDTPAILEQYYNAASGASFGVSNGVLAYLVDRVAGADKVTSVCKYHDYFTSSLINTQRGSMTTFSLAGFAPVIASVTNGVTMGGNGNLQTSLGAVALNPSTSTFTFNGVDNTNNPVVGTGDLKADLSSISTFSIEDLRSAIALQRYKEKLILFGSGNYHDLLLGMYGVAPHDETLQRSEILGGSHQMLNMQQVASTAGAGTPGTASSTNTGTLGAYSVTSGVNRPVIKTFKEPGILMGLCAVRVKHHYSQGLVKLWNKTSRFDFYNGQFDALGEQPIKEVEIFAGNQGTSTNTFAFQEAWAEYRYSPSWIAGDITPGQSIDLTAWTYGDNYASAPTRSAGWIVEDKGRLAQTLAGSTSVAQLIFNFEVINTATRPMSLFSQPSSLGM